MFYSISLLVFYQKTIEETDFAEGTKVSKDCHGIHDGHHTPLGLVQSSLRSLGFLADRALEPDIDVEDREIGNTVQSYDLSNDLGSEETGVQEAKEELITMLELPVIGNTAHSVGLSVNLGSEEKGVQEAKEEIIAVLKLPR